MIAWQQHWNALAPREQFLVRLALVLVTLTVIWLLVVGPSLRVLRAAPARAAAEEQQLAHMRALQAQAQAIQRQAPLSYDDGVRALGQATRQTLGDSGQIRFQGDQAIVTLQACAPQALAQWLSEARLNARSVPVEARLARVSTAAGVRWSGSVVLALPTRGTTG